MFHVPEQYRVTSGQFASGPEDGNNGLFIYQRNGDFMRMIAADGALWEHVSVSFAHRCPTWDEMCLVKDYFWDLEDTVMQFHPGKSMYVNFHKYTLHLWREAGINAKLPPMILV